MTGTGLMSLSTSAFHEYHEHHNSIQPFSLGFLFTQIYNANTRALSRFMQIITEYHYEFITDIDRLHMEPRYPQGKAKKRHLVKKKKIH